MKRRKWLAILLAMALALSLLPLSAMAADDSPTSGTCGENVMWHFDASTGTLTISGSGPMEDYVRIGSNGPGNVVAKIGDSMGSLSKMDIPWYRYFTAVRTLIITSGVTSIGSGAFSFLESLTSVTISSSATSIGHLAFYGCSRLTSVTIPNSVTSIGEWAFSDCSSLTSVTIPNSVTSINEWAFSHCNSLNSVVIPNSVTKISHSVFWFCSSLTSVTIPNSVTIIVDNAFFFSSLTDVYYGGSESQWKQISIGYSNEDLTNATIHYSGVSAPTETETPSVPALTDGEADEAFQKTNTYTSGQFTDVPATSWYAECVGIAYEYGIMVGVSSTSFDPDGLFTVASAIAIACRLHSLYYKNKTVFSSGDPWYQSYVDYAQKNKIIDSSQEYAYDEPITRADFALLISNALPDSVLQKINEIWGCDIPGVSTGSPYMDAVNALANAGILTSRNAFQIYFMSSIYGDSLGIDNAYSTSDSFQAIYRLYRAGILIGNDEYGTFTPDENITRSAVAAIVGRVVEPGQRKHITLMPKPVQLVPMNQLESLSSIRKKASNAELAQAYEAAKEIVEPLANLSREAQLCGISLVLRIITENDVTYSMSAPHYNDPYGFFNLHTASCAGCTRATGLCLNMLGISYEHINENGYSHQ